MTGVDTNVLVRYFAKDDPLQSRRAVSFIRSLSAPDPAFISHVALIELVWVLGSCYNLAKSDVIDCIRHLLNATEIAVEAPSAVAQALDRFEEGNADFPDFLIERVGHLAGCSRTVTFDRQAAASAGMVLL